MVRSSAEYCSLTEICIGTTKLSTLPIIGSFFRNETFPSNWHRSATPITGNTHGVIVTELLSALPFVPGRNNEQGVYSAYPAPPAPFNANFVSLSNSGG